MYGILFIVVFCETGLIVTPFLPGDSLLFAVGALVAIPETGLSLPLMFGLLTAAVILDDESNAVYTSPGSGSGYADNSVASGMAAASFGMTGFGITLCDIGNDGELDMVVANGRVRRKAKRDPGAGRTVTLGDKEASGNSFWPAYAEHSGLFRQKAGMIVADSSASSELVNTPAVARSLCHGDINNDGRLDFLVTYLDRPAAVCINKTNCSGPNGLLCDAPILKPTQ